MTNKAIFLDKDGTIIKNVPYNTNRVCVEFLPGVIKRLKKLQNAGFMLFVVTNQSGVARGKFSAEELHDYFDFIDNYLVLNEIEISGWYYCPHLPEGIVREYSINCTCRKPSPGMIMQAARSFKVDLTQSWMIGDILDDVEAGNTAGCKTILINNGNETEWKIAKSTRRPSYIASTFKEAVDEILRNTDQGINMYE